MAKRESATQRKLFEESSAETGAEKVAYLLTNQNNLNYILSNGWIVPREIYSKYYPDPSEHTPGFVPLMLLPPSEELVRTTTEQSDSSFPVVVEINIADLEGEILVVTSTGITDTIRNSHELSDDHLVMMLRGAIPLNRVNTVYFRDQRDLKEFSIRPYVARRDVKSSVSRDLFDSASDVSVDLLAAVAVDEVDAEGFLQEQVYRNASAFAGVAILLSNALSISPGLPLSAMHSLLRPLVRKGEYSDLPDSIDGDSPVNYWLMLAALTISDQDYRAKSVQLDTLLYSRMTEQQVADTILLKATLHGLLSYEDPQTFVPSQFLDIVLRDFTQHLSAVFSDRIDRLAEQYRLVFDLIQQVLESSISLDEFFAFLSMDTEVTTALLCFLLRHHPEDVLTWADDLREYNWGTLALAALLSGTLYGRSRIPIVSGQHSRMIDFIDYLAASVVNRRLGSICFKELEDALQIIEDGETTQLLYKDRVLFAKQVASGVEHLVDKLLASAFDSPLEERVGILLSRKLKWDHCLTTVIRLDDRDFALQHHGSRKEIRIVGETETRLQLNVAEFRKQLHQTDRSLVSTQIDSEIRRLFSRTRSV